ncbi:MAG: bifunctional acetate--CoA ligase family protein/GNAT family N-acetyltransferase [Gemmataceae bacterium]
MARARHSLDPIFKPRSVADVGASATPGSVGAILMRNLLGNPFGGVVFPINPRRESVHGVYCYPSLAALPTTPDLVVIATPAATVPGVVEEGLARGVPAAIIISAGFSELGPKGRDLERQIRELARGRMRIIGPNCLGVIHPPSNLNASFAADMARPGNVALLSQSGAICTAILDWARETHVGFSSFVSVGAMLDIDFADLIDYFADDPVTRSIILYMESIGDVRKFLSAARSASRAKQVIVVKSGRHEAGARAAASHTGALAGADAVFEAAFRRAGVLRVTSIPDLFHMSEILAMQPRPLGPALAIVTNAGGPGVMATDELMTQGGQLASLSADTLAALNAALPPFWSQGNPIDILGDATPDRYRVAVEACVKDPGVQGVLVLLSPQAMTDPTETARRLAPFARTPHKPILACWLGGPGVREGRDVLSLASIPTFDAPEAAIRAFLHMVQYRRNQELLHEAPEALPDDWQPHGQRVKQLIARARAESRTLLTEAEAKELLAAYGLPVVQSVPCRTMEAAVQAAKQVRFPVVVKLLSTTVTHKSDVGGVVLNLTDEAAVCAAFDAIRAAVTKKVSPEAFEGVTVQPMIKDKGYELIVGSTVDRQFGPVILFGAGGILVEVTKDSSLALPPLNRTLARRLMERTQIYRALQGVRGQAAVDLVALETMLVRFSQLLVDFPELLEVDLNPVLATPQRVLALDARVVLSPANQAPEDRPRLAIHPYPNQYTAPFTLNDGARVTVRAIRPEDEPLIIGLHGRHSEHTIRMRFFSLVKTLSRDSLIRLCHLDYDREMALAAVLTEEAGPRFLGVARYYLTPETGRAEFALVVEDAFQRKGVGRHLLSRLIDIARERGVKTLYGQVLRENTPMLALTVALGFGPPQAVESDVVQVEMDLTSRA